ncbi:hypothetical protein [Kribbella sp. NPDC051718]|uniref:hypothetical protein n=1 Tax=Kribbella sp. NPDC051718 TaxID=3155168 RepID=UPI00341303D9
MTAPAKVLRSAAIGFALGLSWGVAARVWMRLIATDPEFTWTGTGMILGSTAIGGLVLGFLHGARRAGWSRAWRLLGLCWLLVFAGPGIVFLPVFYLGGLLSFHRGWQKAAGAAGMASGVVLLWLTTRQDPPSSYTTLYGGFFVLSLALAAGGAELYRPTGSVRRELVRQ